MVAQEGWTAMRRSLLLPPAWTAMRRSLLLLPPAWTAMRRSLLLLPPAWTAMRRPVLQPTWSRGTAVLMLLLALMSALQHPTQDYDNLKHAYLLIITGLILSTYESTLTSKLWPSEEPSHVLTTSEVLRAMEQTAETGNVTFHDNTTQPSMDAMDNYTSPTDSVQNNTTVQLGDINPVESSPVPSLQPSDSGLSHTSTLPLLMYSYSASSYAPTIPGTVHSIPLSSSLSLPSSPLPYQSSISGTTDKSSTNVPYTNTDSSVTLGTNVQKTLNQDKITNSINSTYIPTSNILIPQTTSVPGDADPQITVFMEGSTTVEPKTVQLTSRMLSTKSGIEASDMKPTTLHPNISVTPSIETQNITAVSITIGLENTAMDIGTSKTDKIGKSQTIINLNTRTKTINPVSESSAIMVSLDTQTTGTSIFTELNTETLTTAVTISETSTLTVNTSLHDTTKEIGETQGITGTKTLLSSIATSNFLQSKTSPDLTTTSENGHEFQTSTKDPMISERFTSLRPSSEEQISTSIPSEYTSSSYFYIDTVSSTIQPKVSQISSVETRTSATELTNSQSAMPSMIATDKFVPIFSNTPVSYPIMSTLLIPSHSSDANTHNIVTSFTKAPFTSSTTNSDITADITKETTYFVSTNTKSTTSANIMPSSTISHAEEITFEVVTGTNIAVNTPRAVSLTDDTTVSTTVSTPGATNEEMTMWNFTEFASSKSTVASYSESATEMSSSTRTSKVTSTPGDNTHIYQTYSIGVTDNPVVSENNTVLITITEPNTMTRNTLSPSDVLTISADNREEPHTNGLITTLSLRQTTTWPITKAISGSHTTWVLSDSSSNPLPAEMSTSTLLTSETVSNTFEPFTSTETPSIDMHTESPLTYSIGSSHYTVTNTPFSNKESAVSLSTMTDFGTSGNNDFLTTQEIASNFGTSMEQNTNAPTLNTIEEITTHNLITSWSNTEIGTKDTDLTSPLHLLSSFTSSSSPSRATGATENFVSTWTSSATSESEADTITNLHNITEVSQFSSLTQTELGTLTSTGSSASSFTVIPTNLNTDTEQSISTTVSDVTLSMKTTPTNTLTTVTIVDHHTQMSATALPRTLNTSPFSSSQGRYTVVVETATEADSQPTLTAEVTSEPTVYTSTNEITMLSNGFSTVSSFQTSSTSSVEAQTVVSSETVTYNTVSAENLPTSVHPSQLSYSSIAHLSMSTETPLSSSVEQEYINQTSQETSPSIINETFSTTESSVFQPTSEKLIEPETTSTNTYSLSPTDTFSMSLNSESTTSSTHMLITIGNVTITQHNTTDTAETLTYLQSTSSNEASFTVTESIIPPISNTTSPTTSHFPSPSTSPHSSTFPYTTAIVPTSISGSLSTVSTMATSAEVSSFSPTENITKNFNHTTTPSSSYITHAVPTSHASGTNTLLSILTTRTSQVHTLNVTSKPTNFATTNQTIHTPTTVFPQTPLISSTVPVPHLSTATVDTTSSIATHAPTTHMPTRITATSLSDTTTTSITHPQNITTSSVASTVMSTKITLAPMTPETNATAALSTILTTILSTIRTTISPFECQLSSETMVKTVLSLMSQPTSEQQKTYLQTLVDFLISTLNKALRKPIQISVNQTSVTIQSRNMTVGYSVIVNSSIYIPSAIVSILTGSDVFNVTSLKNKISNLQSVPVIAETWEAQPAINFRVKTVLKLMGTGGNENTCAYVRSMEQKLQTAFEKAVMTSISISSYSLSVQILSTLKASPYLTLIYVVKNNSQPLNGTTASSLLNVLSGEVVGYYLGDPPSIIAEPLYYPTIDISAATMNYWVTTVIQGVDSQLLGPSNQSFARQMEERLAQLFQLSSQQSRRFKRATTVGSYTVQMVQMQRLGGANNLAELIYYALNNGQPIPGTVAAKQLSTIDPQTMALTLGYIVKVQANAVVQKPPNNLWIIAAVLAPIAVVTVIIIIITAVLCRKNKSDFKSDNMSNMPPRTKPVQGFDYAKQHLGQQGGDEDVLPAAHETVVPSLNLSQERDSIKDGSTEKMLKSSDTRKSRSPCENGSVISNESDEGSSDRSTPQKLMAQHRMTKDEACKWNGLKKHKKKIVPISDEEEGNIHFDKNNKMVPDPFDSSSGSVKLIAIKPVSMPPSLSVTDRNQEMSIINGEVNKALKQKSDIEHYRNKLRLKAKRKGYYDFPPIDSKSLSDKKRKAMENAQMEIDNVLEGKTDSCPPFADSKNRQPSVKNHPYRSRQSLNSPSPGETEMDLLVTRERPRRGIRNSGYDTEPEVIEETNIDRVKQARTYIKSRQAKGHSETSTLSSQPSIDEVRQQMHMLLEEAFSLASAGRGGSKRQADPYASAQHMPYSEVVTSAPGTMSRPRMQWVPTYGPEMYQYSLPRPTYRFSQLPEMVMGSPPPPVPPRTGPVAVPSLRRSTSDMTNKSRVPEPSGNEQGPGNSVPAVFAIPGNRAGYTGYYIPQPPAAYRNHAWMSYSGENDLPGQWADSVPLPGYIEAYPRSRYPQNSPSRLPRQFGQPVNLHPSLDHTAGASIGASQQSLADTDTPDASITNLSTAALVKAIREEVAKLAKKQTDMFEFQV
ncbi:UPF0606 protein KIAA1549L homolog [Mantella aurantiaca]